MKTTNDNDAYKALNKHNKENRRKIDVLCQECKEVMTVGKPKVLTRAKYMCLDCYNIKYCVEIVRKYRKEKKDDVVWIEPNVVSDSGRDETDN